MAFKKAKLWSNIKPSLGYRINWGHSITKDLVGWWLFNEGAGDKIRDLVRRNDGTLTGMAAPSTATSGWARSKFGTGVMFDGTNDHVDLTSFSSSFPSAKGTAVIWIRQDSGTGLRELLNFRADGNNEIGITQFNGNFSLNFRFAHVAGGVFKTINITSVSNDNRWRCIAMTWTKENDQFKAYVDGVQVGTTQTAIGTFAGTVTTPYIGRNSSGDYWFGSVDNFRMYKRALSQTEIMQLYTYPFLGIETPRWKMRSQVPTGIQFDTASNSGYQAAASTYNWNHTCTGADRYLVVGVSMLSLAQTVTGITYNSVAMTFLGSRNSVSGAARIEQWGLVAPSTGTNPIAVTLSGAIASAGNASSYTGVHQTSPTEAFNSAQATNVGAADATVNITTVADNDWVVDTVATDDTAITVGAGQTQTGNVTGAGGSGAMSYEGPKTPAGAVTMSWTDVAALATWTTGGIALRPVAASSLSLARVFAYIFG